MYESEFDVGSDKITICDPYVEDGDNTVSLATSEGHYYVHIAEKGPSTVALIHNEDMSPHDLRAKTFMRVGVVDSESSVVAITASTPLAVLNHMNDLYQDADDAEQEKLNANQFYEMDHGVALHLLMDGPVTVYHSGSSILLMNGEIPLDVAAKMVEIGKQKKTLTDARANAHARLHRRSDFINKMLRG